MKKLLIQTVRLTNSVHKPKGEQKCSPFFYFTMSVFDNIKSIEFDRNKNKIFGIKSGIVWANSNRVNGQYPLLYISKPKNISQEDFEELLNKISISFTR